MGFCVLKGAKMSIFYNNVYKTPYSGTKPGLMGNTSFQKRNRKIYLTMLCNSYGSSWYKQGFFVSKKGSKCLFSTLMFTKQLKTFTKQGLMGNISFQTRNRKIYLTMLGKSYGYSGPNRGFLVS